MKNINEKDAYFDHMRTLKHAYLFSKLATFGVSAEEEVDVHLFMQLIFFYTL